MASPTPTSSTPKRVPLGARDVNTPTTTPGQVHGHNVKGHINKPKTSPRKSFHINSPSKSRAASTLSAAGATENSVARAGFSLTPGRGEKRLVEISVEEEGQSHKRRAGEMEEAPHAASDEPVGSAKSDLLKGAVDDSSPMKLARSAGSPASSFASGEDSLSIDDSQNTVVTMPDDGPLPNAVIPPVIPHPAPSLDKDTLRDRANTLRLRLQLASYKVNTNQIEVPLDRLQVRTTTETPTLPKLPRSTSPFRTSFPQNPTTATNTRPGASTIPNINVQRPSSSTQEVRTEIPSSPPSTESKFPSSNENEECWREEFATPLPPRQRERLMPSMVGSESPVRSQSRAERELTSSVVKGRAADGLLSLSKSQE